jgi:AraC-like DNA-binding protein
MGSVRKPRLLWFDCTTGVQDAELQVQCATIFEVAQALDVADAVATIEHAKPNVLCFDFDHPDQSRLSAMQVVKKTYPKLPILMLTLDHSEALAVWAFRARVWNYLVKPVPPAEFTENLEALARIGNRASPPRVAETLDSAVPQDLPVQPIDADVARLQPALHYVKQHYHEKVSATSAAAACGLSRYEFSRKFRAAYGLTFREYLLRARVVEARRLLLGGGMTVTEVAYAVGFNDGSHFADIFKRYTYVRPSEYGTARSAAQQTLDLGDPDGGQSGTRPATQRRRQADRRSGGRDRRSEY